MAYLSGWKQQRIKITIDQDKIDTAALMWFPDTVFLTVTNAHKVFLELTTDAEYLKVAFTKADGTTQLYAEMELFDVSEEKAIFHVSKSDWVINYDADTIFYMYYDKDHADNTDYIGAIDTAVGGNVWDGNYKAVYHLVDATTSTVKDSTSNNNDGTKKGVGEPASATGKVGLAQDFDGINDYVRAADNATLDFAAGFTIEAIAKPDNLDAEGMLIARLDITSLDGYFLYQWTTGSGDWEFQVYVNNVTKTIVSDAAPSGALQHIVGVRTAAGAMTMYVDGAIQTATNTNAGAIDVTNPLYMGTTWNGVNNPYAGIEDEVRLSSIARSAAWIKAEYNSLWDTLQTYEYDEITILEFSETLSIVDTKATSGTLAKAETLSIADAKITSGSLGFIETLNIVDSWSSLLAFFETLSIADSKLLTGTLGLTETLGIVDSATFQCIKTFYETLSIIDTKITSGSLSFAETLSIVDSWTVLKTFFETLSIADTVTMGGSLNVSEIISIIDSFIRWIEHPIYTEPTKSSLSYTEPTKTNPVYTKPAKGTTSFTKPAKTNPVYTKPTKGHPVYTEPTKEIRLD